MGQTNTQKQSSTGKQTVIILILLIFMGILIYLSLIFFAKMHTYKMIAEDLNIQIQNHKDNYNIFKNKAIKNIMILNNDDFKTSNSIKKKL